MSNYTPYEVAVDGFSGPLEALVAALERRKLTVERVSLSTVTEDFFTYLDRLLAIPEPRPVSALYAIADFLSVASKLVLIKSKWLVPDLVLSDDEAADISDLEMRVSLYQRLKPVVHVFRRAWQDRHPVYARSYFLAYRTTTAAPVVFAPPPRGLTTDVLTMHVERMLTLATRQTIEVQHVRERVLSLSAAVTEMLSRVTQLASTTFAALTGSRAKGDVLVLFLALLHLARDQRVRVVQDEHFSDIVVHTTSPS